MAIPLRNCRVCGRMLYLNPEKKSGVCDVCRRGPPLHTCLKCGFTLLSASEKTGGLCRRCITVQVRCSACGRVLESAKEKSAGVCSACKSQTESIPQRRVRGA